MVRKHIMISTRLKTPVYTSVLPVASLVKLRVGVDFIPAQVATLYAYLMCEENPIGSQL